MRFRLDTYNPIDLAVPVLLAAGSVLAHALDAGPWVEVPVGLASVLFAPGYALLAFLFPRKVVLVRDGVEHRPLSPLGWVAGSIALSMAVGVLVGLVLNFFEGGISAGAFLTVNCTLIAVFAAGAIVRRANVPFEDRLRLRADWSFSFKGRSGHDTAVAVLLIVSAALVFGAIAFAVAFGEDEERFTEFYVLGSDGTAACFPARFQGGQYTVRPPQTCQGLGNVTVGVVNHEGETTSYWMRAVWTNETVDQEILAAEVWTTQQFTLQPLPLDLRLGTEFEPQHEIALSLPPPPGNGTWRLSFQLYREAPPPVQPTQEFLASPYRRVHLWIQA